MKIAAAWLDMYHRARSAGLSHETAMSILVDPVDLDKITLRDYYTMKPVVQHADQAIKGICCHCGSSMVYRRIDGITVICYSCGNLNVEPPDPHEKLRYDLKETIAAWESDKCSDNDAMNGVARIVSCFDLERYKERNGFASHPPPDPYARFRDAIREGKRVFVEGFTQHTKGKMIPLGEYPLKWEASPDIFFIEGVDIPTQPTKDWLDKYGVGLNGECKVPDFDKDEWCAPRDLEYGPPVHAGVPNPNYYSGRRWIVRKVEKDDGFDAWWAGDGWNVCYGQNKQKELFRKVWTAAQKAKP